MSEDQPVRIHCFAHAGAGVSSFYSWTESLGPDVRAQPMLLPGREGRRGEPRVTGREALLADLAGLFADPEPGPYVLYGHSLGAMIAYTLTRALHEAGLPGPALLAVGACPPPDAASGLSDACAAPDEELLRLLEEVDGVPEGAAPGGFWYRAVMPVLRDDLALASSLRTAARKPVVGGPLSVPLLVVSGADDPLAQPETMAGWRRWTEGRVVTRTVPGGHFFVRDRELPRLLGRACRVVRRATAGLVPAGVQT
ncbi:MULTISPECIES: alpha/beta fold hydrolase [unclassified Streptomyces]|uniref:thioesterase II family protein n=1 Tax=unclassified Streptomyces TaxID=2593676 RepID=UPI002DD7B9DE|nr:alpha/beta fold hydrolase [Streptomyces sp. NBC_01750]WSA98263.1 alpha/beta fold hydrolase [Streptomyces sp. NBC_01794]WSD37199.1 alpha/beta fold hydrolase [Streptomyces sp. NBC_01750]